MSLRPVRPTAGRSDGSAPSQTSGQAPAGRPMRGAPSAGAAAPAAGRRTRGGTADVASAPASGAPVAGRRPVRGEVAAPAGASAAARPGSRAAARSAVAAATPEQATAAGEGHADKPRDMISAIEELEYLLDSENESLRQHDIEIVKGNVERKQQLTRAYMQQMIAFKKNPKLVETLPAERQRDLKSSLKRLEPLIAENGRLLKAKIDSINRFMGVVVDAVRDEKAKSAVVYGTDGGMSGGPTENRHMAVALNQEL